MKSLRSFGHVRAQRLGCAALLGCLLVPMIFLAVLKSSSHPLAILSMQLSVHAYVPVLMDQSNSQKPAHAESEMTKLSLIEEKPWDNNKTRADTDITIPLAQEEKLEDKTSADSEVTNLSPTMKEKQEQNNSVTVDVETEMTKLSLPIEEKPWEHKTMTDSEMTKPLDLEEKLEDKSDTEMIELPNVSKEKLVPNNTIAGAEMKLQLDLVEKQGSEVTNLSPTLEEKQEQNKTITGGILQESKILCDFSERRSDTCMMHGDVRVLGYSSSIILAESSQSRSSTRNETWRIRPYARKWEAPVMEYIKELSLRSSTDPKEIPHCALNHSIPAIVFSTGGFQGNFFHDFTDVLIPLFITSRQYQGEVQFLITNFNSKWVNKYQLILKQLSRYQMINLDTDRKVHCFKHVHVGLMSHKVLGIDPTKTPNGYSMSDFRELLRTSFSLKRKSTRRIGDQYSGKKPRLLIMFRKGSRSFTNKREIINMARRVGYKVVATGPEETKNLSRFASVVNSCDVMMGVHGAGLANMIFLPMNATLIQIVPWGGLKWACRHDFGEPAEDMGVRYQEYEIKEEESSLIQEYPRDHAVFTDPLSIQKQGWNMLWSIFLDKQKVKLDVGRFRPFLLEALQSLHQ